MKKAHINQLFFLSMTVLLFFQSCSSSLETGEDGLLYKGRRLYSGKQTENWSLFQYRSETWYHRGVKVLEVHFDMHGDSSYFASYNTAGQLKKEKFWTHAVLQRTVLYNDRGRISREVTYDGLGKLEKKVLFDYDHYGNMREQRELNSAGQLIFRSEFDEENKRLFIQYFSDGFVTHELLHLDGHLMEEYFYNKSGRKYMEKIYDDRELLRDEFHYDEDGKVTEHLQYRYVWSKNDRLLETHVKNLKGEIRKIYQ